MRSTISIRKLAAIGLTAAIGTAGFLAVGAFAGSRAGTGSTVSLRMTKLGRVLVNSRGHTLYLFQKDRNGKSACYGTCATYWPPLLSKGKPTAGTGVKVSLLGTIRRTGGTLQVTYNRHPLYTFAPDTGAGQTKGAGTLAFGARWYAVSSRGTAVFKPPPLVTTAASTTTTTPYSPPPYG